MEVAQTVVEKKNGVSYEDGDKNIIKRKKSVETLVSTKRPYLRPFSPNTRDCDRRPLC